MLTLRLRLALNGLFDFKGARSRRVALQQPEYDALYDQAAREPDPEKAAELFIKMNDMLFEDVVVIPIVQRATEKYGNGKTLNKENNAGGPFDSLYWNITNWNRSG